MGVEFQKPSIKGTNEEQLSQIKGYLLYQLIPQLELELNHIESSESDSTTEFGRVGSGVQYRVSSGGKHIYVSFNFSFTTRNEPVLATSKKIPYPPSRETYAVCHVGFKDGSIGIATISVSSIGIVSIHAVHKLPGATLSTGEMVDWIDGNIDYWI